MKGLIFIFIVILFSIYVQGQAIHQDTSKANCDFYSGKLTEKAFEGGTYIYFISDQYSYVEFTLPYMGESSVKYRVENFLNDRTIIVTKQYSKYIGTISTCFLAIDSIMAGQLKVKKKGLQYLKKNRIYTDVTLYESFIFNYISMHASRQNLQSYFKNFNPILLKGWIKFKQ